MILNDHYNWGYAVLAIVALPIVVSVLAEICRVCIYGGCCCCCCCCMDDKSGQCTNWIGLLFFHLYTIIRYLLKPTIIEINAQEIKKFGNYHSIRFVLFIHRIGGSRCHPRWHHQAMYLRCTQGFLQSAPQLVLQTLILFKVIKIKTFYIIILIV